MEKTTSRTKAIPVVWALAAAAACLVGWKWASSRGTTPPDAETASSTDFMVAAVDLHDPPPAKIFFAGGLVAEDCAQDIGLEGWSVECYHQKMIPNSGPPPYVEVSHQLLATRPARMQVELPGWQGVSVPLPVAEPSGNMFIEAPVRLKREMGSLSLRMPAAGSDYSEAEVKWLRPLPDQPCAVPAPQHVNVDLCFDSVRAIPSIPSGIYALNLKGANSRSIRDFTLDPEFTVASSQSAGQTFQAPLERSLPSSLARTYVGYADGWARADAPDKIIGAFLGLRVDLKHQNGELIIVNMPLTPGQSLRFDNLKPSPDGVWPISNLQLMEPTTLEFDCPFSFADHHFVLKTADGIFTLHGEYYPPENEVFETEMLSRMRTLIRDQSRNAAKDPSRFDPLYSSSPTQALPSFGLLATPGSFSDHLLLLSKTRAYQVELGQAVDADKDQTGAWNVHVVR